MKPADDREKALRIAREACARAGFQIGHDGTHRGTGAPDCPRELHHHHDARCALEDELVSSILALLREERERVVEECIKVITSRRDHEHYLIAAIRERFAAPSEAK